MLELGFKLLTTITTPLDGNQKGEIISFKGDLLFWRFQNKIFS